MAGVLESELDFRVFNYRDTTPLTARQVDDDPYGGGRGMVLRVDVVAAALDAVYGGVREHRSARRGASSTSSSWRSSRRSRR